MGRLPGAGALCAAAAIAEPPATGVPPAMATPPPAMATPPDAVVPGYTLEFPRDYGSHPGFGIEWWYLTGWLTTGAHERLGFQITFFRTRPGLADAQAN